MNGLRKSVVLLIVSAAVLIAGILLRPANPRRVVISRFDSKDAVKRVEYGSRDFNLAVESSVRSASWFGRSLKLSLKLIPGSYNFLACGQGLVEKRCEWESRPAGLDWNDISGISYKIFVEPVKGTEQKPAMVRIATDIIDGDGEILRASRIVHAGEWLEERVYFNELTTRYDYQRDWKSVKWTGTGDDKTSLSRVDNGVKSYQFEVLGIVTERPIDLKTEQIEVVLYIDEVALIR
ncbi:MAG: hypothetical protein WC583_00685 [Candidatus Omnitrophota bacterium]|jgi:hypothetical protein|nr:hypothetical protein [Candidatus Omnitrophota bacterium]MDD3982702.1 hypothetical protein [Candidatus Omnitrophota bacterium]